MPWDNHIIIEDCTGCGICADVCDQGAFKMESEMAYPEPVAGMCEGCNLCVDECPFGAVEVRRVLSSSC